MRKHRSGCGIIPKCRPSGEHNAAMPKGEPLGLKGYASVTSPLSSQYLNGASSDSSTLSNTPPSGKRALPSPCATQMPVVNPSMPSNIIAGDFCIVTELNRHSKRPDSLCTNRGWDASFVPTPGTQPRSAINWQPLQTPRLNVSVRL